MIYSEKCYVISEISDSESWNDFLRCISDDVIMTSSHDLIWLVEPKHKLFF